MDPYDPDDDAEDPVVIKINTPTQIFGHNNVVVTPQTDALSALVAAAGSHNRTAPNPVRVSLQLNRDVNVQGDGNFVGGVASAMAKLGIPQPGQPGAAAGRAAVISGASRAPGPSAGAPGGGAPGELPGDGDKKRKAHEVSERSRSVTVSTLEKRDVGLRSRGLQESENLPDRKRINSPGPVAKASSRH